MAKDGATLISEGNRGKQQTSNEEDNDTSLGEKHSSLSSSSESDSDSEDSNSDELEDDDYSSSDEEENPAKRNLRLLIEAMNSPTNRKLAEARKRRYVPIEEKFNFPKDPENWREEDLRELWADPPWGFAKPGWDPMWATEKDWNAIRKQVEEKKDPSIAPFYLPYRRPFPVIPNNHFDIYSPKSVIEELDRIEEFLKWVSFVFNDGSTYEGTVWDDAAHGKGVYVAEKGLVRYEGEWLHNEMEGHGVVEVDIPDVQPVPGSKLESKMRKKGRIITRDFMTPEDRSWLEMDIEDTLHLVGGNREIPFYENNEWVKSYGTKPEKGRYRYAGQWKHGRIHGCGVFEVNERVIYGRFYFGHHLEDSSGCDSDVSALHAGIAEVAAAKARMFINKPDGMVREERGPYGDPQHPYFYEDDDAWMAPGFINQFYDVPDYWKTYVEEVDQERQMWLNSFYKAPLRIPMPAELEHWWSKDPDNPEFVLINQEPEPDPEDPSKLIYTEDPLILHTPTGRLINYVEDEKYGLRLFWQPHLKEGEDVDPDKAVFLPLGFDEFYGRVQPSEKKPARFAELLMSAADVVRLALERLDKWVEEKKKASETRQKHIERELEYIEAEICLEEAVEDLELELKMLEQEEEAEDTSEIMLEEEEAKGTSKISDSTDRAEVPEAGEDESEDSEDEDDEGAPTSFGSVGDQSTEGESKPGSSPFSSLSVSLASLGWASMLPCKLQNSFSLWRQLIPTQASSLNPNPSSCRTVGIQSKPPLQPKLRAVHQQLKGYYRTRTGHDAQLSSLARLLSSRRICENSKTNLEAGRLVGLEKCTNVLSLCVPLSDTALMD